MYLLPLYLSVNVFFVLISFVLLSKFKYIFSCGNGEAQTLDHGISSPVEQKKLCNNVKIQRNHFRYRYEKAESGRQFTIEELTIKKKTILRLCADSKEGSESVAVMDPLEFVDHGSNGFLAELSLTITAFNQTFAGSMGQPGSAG
jgi:hypothetical protein